MSWRVWAISYENPQIGLMFIDFFSSSIGLHVNGKAEIITEKEASKFVNPIDKAKAEKDGQHKTKLWIKIKLKKPISIAPSISLN